MHLSVYKRPLLWVLVIFISYLVLFYRPQPGRADVSSLISPQEIQLTGRVDSFAVSKKDSYNVVLSVESADGQPAKGRVYARIRGQAPLWKDVIALKGKLKKPYNVDLLGNFAWGDYLAVKGIFSEIRADGFSVQRPAAWPYRWIRAVRADILETFNKNFGPELAGIAGGVVLGERGETSPQLYSAFQDSGAIHLLVASGGNVGFVTLMVFGLCRWIGLGRKYTALLSLGAAGLYTLIAGADAPLVRAYLMAAGACAGYLLNRNSGVFQGLLLSCTLILIFRPAAVFETGFQMSFLATLAIIICLSNWKVPSGWPRPVRFFAQIFLATLASQLALLPVFTNVFYKVSVTGLVSNMILVPLASLIMGLGFGFYVFSLLKVGFLLKGILWGVLFLFKELVIYFASFHFSALPVCAWPGGYVGAYYVGLFGLFHLPRKDFGFKAQAACVVAAILLFTGQSIMNHRNRVWLLREWNHSAALVRTCRGETLLFGTDLAAEKIVRSVLKSGARRIDFVFTAEPSFSPAMQALREKIPVGKIFSFPTDLWPGETASLDRGTVMAQWGVYLRRDGSAWQERGYSGQAQDQLSYRVEVCGERWLLGAGQRFVQKEGERPLRAERNRTVFLFI